MSNPYEQPYNDSCCAWCGQNLPPDPVEGSWAFHGVCDARCALLQGLSDVGISNGMKAPKGITPEYSALILSAASELCRDLSSLQQCPNCGLNYTGFYGERK